MQIHIQLNIVIKLNFYIVDIILSMCIFVKIRCSLLMFLGIVKVEGCQGSWQCESQDLQSPSIPFMWLSAEQQHQ